MDDELLSLKWNNHQTTFIRIISNLRTKNAFADATLACNGRFYSVHRFVLSSCSAYFSSIFDQVVSKNLVIVLKDITCSILEYLLDYMYNGEINVRQNELASLVKAAECLRIKGLAVADDVDTYLPDKKSRKLKAHCSNDGYKNASNQKGLIEHQNPIASDDKVNKQCLGLSDFDHNESDLHRTVLQGNLINNSMSEKKNILEKIIKQEPTEELKFLDDCDGVNSNILKYKKENTMGLSENLSSSEMRMFETDEFSICAPGTSSTMNGHCLVTAIFSNYTFCFELRRFSNYDDLRNSVPIHKLQWESLHPSSSILENNASTFTNCLAAIQQLPDFLTDESVLHSNEICRGNTDFLLQSTNDGSIHKSTYGKFVNMRDTVMKNYKCRHCVYSCHDASNFKRHMQTHTGEKPYKCSFCNYRCIHSSNLKTHIRYKHT